MKEITLKTKFDLGDEVFAIKYPSTTGVEGKIWRIDFEVTNGEVKIWYFIDAEPILEDAVFSSKQEFIDSL